MLLNAATQLGIRDGHIDLVFRRWKKPTVKTGGRLRCAIGELDIVNVSVIAPDALTDAEAVRAGYESRESALAQLFRERPGGNRARGARPDATSELYRIEVAYAGSDQRAQLRQTLLDSAALEDLISQLARMDRRSQRGPWIGGSLKLISSWPARRAPELAELMCWETAPWKAHVRRLKELGLTESLPVGYRLSPRGEQVLARIEQQLLS